MRRKPAVLNSKKGKRGFLLALATSFKGGQCLYNKEARETRRRLEIGQRRSRISDEKKRKSLALEMREGG